MNVDTVLRWFSAVGLAALTSFAVWNIGVGMVMGGALVLLLSLVIFGTIVLGVGLISLFRGHRILACLTAFLAVAGPWLCFFLL